MVAAWVRVLEIVRRKMHTYEMLGWMLVGGIFAQFIYYCIVYCAIYIIQKWKNR